MKRLIRYAKWLIVAAFSLGLLGACGIMRGTPVPTPTPGIAQITADQAAQAMQNDEFFSDYRNEILQVSGTVRAVNAADSTFTLDTGIARIVRCHLDDASQMPAPGASVTLESSEGQREPDAVGLLHCKVITP